MKRFRYRLQTLLDIKKRKEEEIKRKLAEKNNQVLRAQKQLKELHEQLARFQASEKKQRMQSVTVYALRASVVYRYKLQADIAGKGKEIVQLTQDAHTIVKLLTEAKRECKVLEILRDKKLAEWKREYKIEEQEFTDDVSQKGFIRKTRTAALQASA
ncbi:MAG: flagellar export protein FliJ [Chitinivibrionales bacterium]